jgi:hypothetical protein
MIPAGEFDAAVRRHEERETLLCLAAELEDLAERVDTQGRPEAPGLRADAVVLRRLAADLGNRIALTVTTTPYDGPLKTSIAGTADVSDPSTAQVSA